MRIAKQITIALLTVGMLMFMSRPIQAQGNDQTAGLESDIEARRKSASKLSSEIMSHMIRNTPESIASPVRSVGSTKRSGELVRRSCEAEQYHVCL